MEPRATIKQQQYLRGLGVPESVYLGMTMSQADKTIRARENAKERKRKRLEDNNRAVSLSGPAQAKPEHQEPAPMPKTAIYVYDKLCTRKVDNVPALVKELVAEMEIEKGHNVFTSDAIRDAIREAIERRRSARKKPSKRRKESL
jgi:hypothetical protein